jgi:hypothetical protein
MLDGSMDCRVKPGNDEVVRMLAVPARHSAASSHRIARNGGVGRRVDMEATCWPPAAEAAMTTDANTTDANTTDANPNVKAASKPRATNVLHPRVWTLLIGFAAWFAIAVWSFAGGGLSDYLLVIVSGFIFVVVTLQLILSRVGRKNEVTAQDAQTSLRDWTKFDFETWQGRLTGTEAALQILLPIGIAALGMTAFGIVFHIAERGGV